MISRLKHFYIILEGNFYHSIIFIWDTYFWTKDIAAMWQILLSQRKKTNKASYHHSSYKTENRMKYWISTIMDGITVYWSTNSLDKIEVMKHYLPALKMWLWKVVCVLHTQTLLSWREQQSFSINVSLFFLSATWTCYMIIVIEFIIWSIMDITIMERNRKCQFY